jgi:protocatechuate 3,4-dioxygenase, alpha subunit
VARAGLTPSQTIGPFFHDGLAFAHSADLAAAGARGERIHIEGCVRDGAGAPVFDALLEIWQADAEGRYAHPDADAAARADAAADGDGPRDPAFTGFGRTASADDGSFAFATIRPGRVPGPGGRTQAPHLALTVYARGLLCPLHTRIYFEGDPANEKDPILECVPAERRATLIARRSGPGRYRFDIALQGAAETVFFDV